jgi:hypothetical protein
MSVYSNQDIVEVFNLIYNNEQIRLTEISKQTGVSYSMVRQIAAGTKHKWLASIFPEEYVTMLSRKHRRSSYSNSAKACGILYPLIKSPTEEVYLIEHMAHFCKEHSLDPSALAKVLRGERKHHKKWVLA